MMAIPPVELAKHGISQNLFRHRSGNNFAAMFEAYFDESGSKQERKLVVAGYVGSVEQWGRLIDEWNTALDDKHLKYFHAKEFRSNATHYQHLDRAERKDLIFKLGGIVRRRMNFGVIVTVLEDEYNDLTSARFRSQWATAYTFCAQACAMVIASWAEVRGHIDQVNYIFEEGHVNAGQALEHFRRIKANPKWASEYRLGTYGLGAKKDLFPLQAADMLAYGSYEECEKRRRDPTILCSLRTPPHRQGMPHYQIHCNATIIKSLVEEIQNYYQRRKEAKATHNHAEKLIRLAQKQY